MMKENALDYQNKIDKQIIEYYYKINELEFPSIIREEKFISCHLWQRTNLQESTIHDVNRYLEEVTKLF